MKAILSGSLLVWLVCAGVVSAQVRVARALPVHEVNGNGGDVVPAGDEVDVEAVSKVDVPFPDVLTFQNGDRIHGNLMGVMPAPFGLKWQSGELEKPADFSIQRVAHVRFGKKRTSGGAKSEAMIRLSNTDQLRGEIVSLDAEKLILKTWYAGTISFQRPMLAGLKPGLGAISSLYEGPEDLTGWVIGDGGKKGAWSFKNGQLISSGRWPIARNVDNLPNSAEISFDMAWDGGYPALTLSFLTDNLKSMGGNCYSLQMSGNYVYMYRYASSSGSKNLGQNVNIDAFQNNRSRKARVTLYTNKEKKQIYFLVNGNLIKQWTDPDGFPGSGNGILFYPQDQVRTRLSNIRVAAWDGKVPQAVDGGVAVTKEDMLRLTNNDKISGKVKGIAGNVLQFETAFAPLDIPLERVTEIEFGREVQEVARDSKDDVRGELVDGSRITMVLVKVEKDKLEGKSENFGQASFSINAFTGLQFNPHVQQKGEPDLSEPDEDEVMMED